MKDSSSGSVGNYQCVTSVVKYRNCVVDFGPGKAVHCPESNACFLKNEFDCNATHFGYAIPVSVFPVDDEPGFVELVFDASQELDPAVAGYLLQNHPDFKNVRSGALEDDAIAELKNNFSEFTEQLIRDDGHRHDEMKKKMATTAKHEHMTRNYTEPEEDIAAIAKQISDHAEAIYQTWKSRGLAPTEILTCHGNAAAADKFGSTLTPKTGIGSGLGTRNAAEPDILADANKLERLVNNFVVEDKARLAAAKNIKPVQTQKSNTIQYALQKFEKNAGGGAAGRGKAPGTEYPAYRTSPQPTQISRPVPANQIQLQSLDTIEVMLPEEVVRKDTPLPQKRAGSVEFNGSNPGTTGLTTWPLKNKTISQENKKLRQDASKTSPKNSEEFLDEVQREEERLINALKCGMIINEEKEAVDGEGKAGGSRAEGKTSLKSAMDAMNGGDATGKKAAGGASLVDYAKNRYKNAQLGAVQRPEPKSPVHNQTISVVRNRFETVKKVQEEVSWKNKEWVPGKFAEDDGGDKAKVKGTAAPKIRHAASENVPHPELTSQQKQHIRQAGTNPVRPFLTRGSVAERVLIFEKCPTELLLDKRRTATGVATWRTGSEVQTKAQARTKKGCYACEFYRVQEELGLAGPQPKFPYVPPKCRLPRSYNKTYSKEKEKENQRPIQPLHTTLQRHAKANKNVFIPRFYFPQGKPQSQQQIDSVLQKLAADFRTFPMGQVPREKFHIIVKTCECPLYWKVPLFIAAGGEKLGYVDAHSFLDYWKQLASTCHDPAAKFLRILVRSETRNFLLPEDFIPLIQDVVDTHPGLTFLKEANEFHSRYVHTVIARIFYCVNRSWSGRISLPEIRRSNLLQVISLLEEEEDINQITQYFSYEHFYVIYCKFWELDRDHDLFIDRQDLTRHNDHALSSRMIDRIFSGAVTRGSSKISQDKLSYTEFVWFLLSEEDKQHPTAIEYWFRCMDLDGDGYLSMYELEYFYEEQLQRMELLGIATLPFEDCLCQMLDMIHPQTEGKISLADLKKCKMVTIFFDTFFNLEKYLDHEQRDPFASQRDHDADGEVSDWDRYAAEEYEILVAEEEGNDHGDELFYDSDGMSEGVPALEKLIRTFEGVDRIQLPYPGNPQFIAVNHDGRLSKFFATDIQTKGNGSVRIKIPSAEGDPGLVNGSWDSAPEIKLTECEDLAPDPGTRTPERDNCIASV